MVRTPGSPGAPAAPSTPGTPAGVRGDAPPPAALPARRHCRRRLLLLLFPVRLSSPALLMLSALFLSTYLFLCSLPSCYHAAESMPTGDGSEGEGGGSGAAADSTAGGGRRGGGGGGGGGGRGGGGGLVVGAAATGAAEEGRLSAGRGGDAGGRAGARARARMDVAESAPALAGRAATSSLSSSSSSSSAAAATAVDDEEDEDEYSMQAPPITALGSETRPSGEAPRDAAREAARETAREGAEERAAGSRGAPHAARARGTVKTRERGSGLRALQEMSENNDDDAGGGGGRGGELQNNERMKTKKNVYDDDDDTAADGDNADVEEEREEGPQEEEESEGGSPCCKRLPQALIIGVKKGGTRALLEALRLHPAVRALGAEAHFFDRNYERGLHWYRGLMPVTEPGQITMEKTPSYFVTREAPARIRAMGGGRTKLLVVVRDPVTRAVSDYAQTLAKRPRGTPPFRQLAFREGPAAGVAGGGGGASPVVVEPRWSALRIGLYARHLERWLRHFPRENMLFVSGERLATRPAAELARVQDFLGIARLVTRRHFYFNATKGFPCLRRGGLAAAATTAGPGAAAAARGDSSGGGGANDSVGGARPAGNGSPVKAARRRARGNAVARGGGDAGRTGGDSAGDDDAGDGETTGGKRRRRPGERDGAEVEERRRDSAEEEEDDDDGDAEPMEDGEYGERDHWAAGDAEEARWGQPHCLGNSKGRPHPHIEPELLQRLREFYRPFNLKFYQMVGHDFGWD